MRSVDERLQQLRVRDVMTHRVASVPLDLTAAEVAQAMQAARVTAAPVVDQDGVCVGVVTASDFIRHVAGHPQVEMQRVALRDLMSWGVQTIQADAPVLQAARIMCAAHVHRLIVVDSQGRPAGIVSSLDLVAMVAKIVDELSTTQ